MTLAVASIVYCGILGAETLPSDTLASTEVGVDTSAANLQAHAEIVSARHDQAVQAGNEIEARFLAEVKRNIVNTMRSLPPDVLPEAMQDPTAQLAFEPIGQSQATEEPELEERIVVAQVEETGADELERYETFRQPVEEESEERIARRERREHDRDWKDDRERCDVEQCERHHAHPHHKHPRHDQRHHRHGEQEGGRDYHLRTAIRHLHAAGMHDVAERLRHMAEKRRNAHSGSDDRPSRVSHQRIARQLKNALGEIREELEERGGRVNELEEQVEALAEQMEHMQRHLRRRLIEKAEKHDQRLRRGAEQQRYKAKMEAMNRRKEAQILRDQLREEVERRKEATSEETSLLEIP